MPRKPKEAAEGTVHKASKGEARAGRTNGFDPEKARSFIAAAEQEELEIEEIMRKAREACQPHIDEIKDIKKEAAENGIAKKVFSAKLRERAALRKAERRRGTLSEDQQDAFDQLSLALGPLVDTPLGQAAMAGAKPAPASGAPLN